MDKELVKAIDILNDIQRMEQPFTICQNTVLTKEAIAEIDNTNWDALRVSNQKNIVYHDTEHAFDSTWCDFLFRDMEEYQNVSTKLLPDTRYPKIKKIVLRLMNVSTFWQECFNKTVTNFLRQLVAQLGGMDSKISLIQKEIDEHTLFLQLKDSLESKIQQTNASLLCLQDRLEKVTSDIETKKAMYDEYFARLDAAINEYETFHKDVDNAFDRLICQNKEHDRKLILLEEAVNKSQEHDRALGELETLQKQTEAMIKGMTAHIENNEKWLSNVASRVNNNEDWLRIENQRVNSHDTGYRQLREELFWELEYSSSPQKKAAKIIVKDSFYKKKKELQKIRLNVGCGPQDFEGYINVDMRDLPNVDIISDATHLPFENGEVDKIFASHLLEHFTRIQAEHEVLPYWYDLLKDSGELILLLPNIGAMAKKYSEGEIEFEQLALLISGGQEYKGNYHYAAYNPEMIRNLLNKCGFVHVKFDTECRKNGDCWEMEIHARKK